MEKEIAEVMRYLGRKGQEIPPALNAIIEDCLKKMKKSVSPRFVKSYFDIFQDSGGAFLKDTGLVLPGEDISMLLDGCRQVVLFAATLGVGADNLIRRYESVDITKAFTLDACAGVLIEKLCDEIEGSVRMEARANGLFIKPRFSPGYGDLPLSIQPKLLALLSAEKRIGLTCTENLIMLPRKSVTAIIGVSEKPCESSSGCKNCSMNESCRYRR